MDDFRMPFMWHSSLNASKDSDNADPGYGLLADTALRLSSQSIVDVNTCVYGVGGCKRKLNIVDEVQIEKDDISLSLELGSPGSHSYLGSKTDYAAAKTALNSQLHAEKQSPSVGICLGLNIDFRRKRTYKDLNSNGYLEAPSKDNPNVHLDLSLSTGAADSDVTSVTLTSSPNQNAISDIEQLVDEGSTSSKWKRGPVVPLIDMLNGNTTSVVSNAYPVLGSIPLPEMDDVSSNSKQQRKTSVKICQFPGCEKGARGASGRCISHGGGRRCQRPGCPKGAEGKTAFCKAHGGGRRCEHLGCTKSAEGRTNLCIAHGGGKRCGFHGGCNRAARGKSGFCIRHGGGKRCKIENCTKSAEGLAGLCIAHGGGRRCQFPECSKGAQGSTKFCKAHGGGKRCTFLGCTKGAEGSTPFCKGHGGGKRCSFQGGDGVCTKSVHGGTLFCVSHGGGKRCAIVGCSKSARGRTNFCVRHGGGKRCKYEGCEKSAQGSTDFCKAHGGGKRCLWGQQGSGFGGDSEAPCDKFARGKIGLCAAHGAQIQDNRVHGDGTVGLKMKGIANENTFECMNNVGTGSTVWNSFDLHMVTSDDEPSVGPSSNSASLEGRVHGGGFMMAMLGQF